MYVYISSGPREFVYIVDVRVASRRNALLMARACVIRPYTAGVLIGIIK